MKRLLLLSVTLAVGLGFSVVGSAAITSVTSDVQVDSKMSVSEISEYVETVDHRLQKGRYDRVEAKQHKWIIDTIAALRAELKTADSSAPPSENLRALASELETGMVKVEEGGIICRQEQRTGSRMVTQRCFTRKSLAEDAERSRDQLRDLKRPQSLPSGG